MLDYFRSTKFKLRVAGIIYQVLHLVLRKDSRTIKRKHIAYEVDLSEGIDLSLFLFGNFQNYVYRNRFFKLTPDAVVMDVGANIGAISLNLARLVPQGHVYAFEPTDFAYKKLNRNVALNPLLAPRITTTQAFVSDRASGISTLAAYSSWKLNANDARECHPVHGGMAMGTVGVPQLSLDDFIAARQIKRVDLIKIDTDGHELEVIRGARNCLTARSPEVIFELCSYLLEERGISFSDYVKIFSELNYRLICLPSGQLITESNYQTLVPSQGSVDVLATNRPAVRLSRAAQSR
jgi:FkbM family methyltransferase